MKSNIAQDWVQNWTMMGLHARHRAFLRQTVQRCVSVLPQDNAPRVTWRVTDDHWHLPGILIADIAWYCSKLHKNIDSSKELLKRMTSPSENQIRLLWNWSGTNPSDCLSWCTELGFSGLVHDTVSLHHWSLAGVCKGFVSLAQTNPLLADIVLPRF